MSTAEPNKEQPKGSMIGGLLTLAAVGIIIYYCVELFILQK